MCFSIFCVDLALATTAFASPLIRSTNARNNIPDYFSQYTAGFKNQGRFFSRRTGNLHFRPRRRQSVCHKSPLQSSRNHEWHCDHRAFRGGPQSNSTVHEWYVAGNATVSGNFGIYSQVCFPKGHINTITTKFLTHGHGINRSYWNIAPGCSYVDYAASRGYTTFIYDRLGTGLSDHPNGIQVVQLNLQLSINHTLIQFLRTGAIAKTKFSTVIGTGHFFGSFQLHSLATSYPSELQACDGDCLVPFNQSAEAIEKLYPKAAKESDSFNVLGAGHLLPHHYGDQSALVLIHNFLAKNGV